MNKSYLYQVLGEIQCAVVDCAFETIETDKSPEKLRQELSGFALAVAHGAYQRDVLFKLAVNTIIALWRFDLDRPRSAFEEAVSKPNGG